MGRFAKQTDRACPVESLLPRRVVTSYISLATIFIVASLVPLLLLSETGLAQSACSVVNALPTALFRYQPVSVSAYNKVFISHKNQGFSLDTFSLCILK